MLEIAIGVLGILWVATLGVLMNHIKGQRKLSEARELADNAREQRIRELVRRVESFQKSTIGMGEGLHELRALVAPLPDKITALEQRDPSTLTFAQAARLVGMGASVDELTQSCGLTQAEAQLMSKLHRNNE